MDYCSTCRRHLNGALVCPGCGAYAPDIAPQIIAAPSPAPAPLNSLSSPGSLDSPDSPDLESVTPPAPQGRAARRRQLARWKKNQRRAVVATAVALVGGGLTVASLDRGTGDQTQAATAPELPTTSNDEQPTSDHTRPTVTRSHAHRSTPSSTLPSQPQSRANTHPGSLASTPTPPTNSTNSTNSTRTSSVPHQRTGTSSYNGTVSTTTASTDTAGTTNTTGTAGATGTTAQQSPAPATTGGTESSTSTGSTSTGSTSTGSTNPAPAATSPSNICVLGLICL